MRVKKPKGLWLIVILSAFVFVACTNDEDQVEYGENGYDELAEAPENGDDAPDEVEESTEVVEDRAPFVPRWLSITLVTEGERDMMLEDLDYLAEFMLENAPTLGVFERRFGIAMEDAFADMRYGIYNLEVSDHISTEEQDREAAANNLYRLLVWFEEQVERMGHFGPVWSGTYINLLETALARENQSEIIDNRVTIDGEDFGDASRLQGWIDVYAADATLWFYDVELDDLDLYQDLSVVGWEIEGNVTTEIIEEDRIAYFSIGSFASIATLDSEILFPFFEEVQGFEHLIIDLRGNTGGFPIYFEQYVMAMLIDSPVEVRFNEFSTSGAAAREEAELSLDWPITGRTTSADEILLAADFVNEQSFPYFNEADLEILTYVIPWLVEVEPREDNIPFAGEIWLLVDHMSGSASEFAAMKSIYSGFATVVGVPTRRVTPVQTTHVSLPNTGILFRVDVGYIIDDLGRSLEEYGVTPDIVIELGSDALDVVLDLIEEQ